MPHSNLSLRLRFGSELVFVARRWRQVVDQRLVARGLSDASWTSLFHLSVAGDGITQKELARLIGLDGSSLVRTLDHLSERGLIERRVDDHDRRVRRIHLTDDGQSTAQTIREKLTSAEFELLAESSDDELQGLVEAFGRLSQHIAVLEDGEGEHHDE